MAKNIGVWIIICAIGLAVFAFYNRNADKPVEIPYSELIYIIKTEQVSEIEISGDTAKVKRRDSSNGVESECVAEIPGSEQFHKDIGEELLEQEATGGIKVTYDEPRFSLLSSFEIVFFVILLFILLSTFTKKGAGGGFTKSRAKLAVDKKDITFENVAGADEEKAELEEVVDFLKAPEKYTKLGAKIPRGILLVGSPGNGKTLLAKAVAGEAGVPFFSISGSDFVELYVGVGASRVRDLFEQAKKAKPCIVFIDEIDAVGRKRGAGMGGGHDEREQTLNQLLVEMDGFSENDGVIIIAATNRPDILDKALLRPGRFDRQIVVDYPDIKGREEVLKVHAKGKPLADDVDLAKIAKITTGYSGAELSNLLNEAAILAAKADREEIKSEDIEAANLKVMMGSEKRSRVLSDEEKKLTAYHEAGHAVVARVVDNTQSVTTVSIIPRGRAGGFTMYQPESDNRMYASRNEMLNKIIVMLGGRVAEAVVLDDISTGASNDIERATALARDMVLRYGMSEKIGPVSYDDGGEVFIGRDYGHAKAYSENTASEIDAEIKNIIMKQYKATEKIINENREVLEKVAELLLEKETITGDEFEACFNERGE
ncbi:MAG: ATP-dependent zinc metalloprotease FtsH [Clostridia bacterium]|nr:ATP-dependent zinc metalloprotease FtsH [Clostridia bacterium]